jgi:hypothetical protein
LKELRLCQAGFESFLSHWNIAYIEEYHLDESYRKSDSMHKVGESIAATLTAVASSIYKLLNTRHLNESTNDGLRTSLLTKVEDAFIGNEFKFYQELSYVFANTEDCINRLQVCMSIILDSLRISLGDEIHDEMNQLWRCLSMLAVQDLVIRIHMFPWLNWSTREKRHLNAISRDIQLKRLVERFDDILYCTPSSQEKEWLSQHDLSSSNKRCSTRNGLNINDKMLFEVSSLVEQINHVAIRKVSPALDLIDRAGGAGEFCAQQ